MKVGDYVRTRDGIIQKITDVFDTSMEIATDKGERIYRYIDIIKSSPNIIDLIEVGDYVNGREIDFIGKEGVYSDYDNAQYYYFEEKDIKTIVTKKQFESMQYEVK